MIEWAYTPVGVFVLSFTILVFGMHNAKVLLENKRIIWKVVGMIYGVMQLLTMFLFYESLVSHTK